MNDITKNPSSLIIEEAKQISNDLMTLVRENKWLVKVNNKEYLVFEAWQTLARFMNWTVKTEWTRPIEYGGASGFEARGVVVDKEGNEVGAGEAMCLDNERNWKGKDAFSIRAMAQTRSMARALRQNLGWIAVLAGFAPSVAEEMDGVEEDKSYPATEKQIKFIRYLANTKQVEEAVICEGRKVAKLEDLSMDQAGDVIKNLKKHESTPLLVENYKEYEN